MTSECFHRLRQPCLTIWLIGWFANVPVKGVPMVLSGPHLSCSSRMCWVSSSTARTSPCLDLLEPFLSILSSRLSSLLCFPNLKNRKGKREFKWKSDFSLLSQHASVFLHEWSEIKVSKCQNSTGNSTFLIILGFFHVHAEQFIEK